MKALIFHDLHDFAGTKSLNKTQSSTNRRVNAVETIAFVTVFSVYNFSADASRVTVGNISYSKVERSMAILNVFINFIQVSFN